jgi:hypothetical protein
MDDAETVVTEVYVLVDERVQAWIRDEPRRRGPAPALCAAEVITLALVGRLYMDSSTSNYYAYAQRHFRPLFPRLPHRSQYLRQLKRWASLITRFALELADELIADEAPVYEVLDSTAVPTRNRCHRGSGWLVDTADIGSSSRLIWYEGVHLLTSATPDGVVTGFGAAPASANDRTMADDFFAARHGDRDDLPSVGRARCITYLADMGFGGAECERRWFENARAQVICRPQPDRKTRVWTEETGHWVDCHRQVIEHVFARWQYAFHLGRDRPHSRWGLLVIIAAVAAIHNLTILINRFHHRPPMSYAHLVLR